jgi:hypothetical protein
VPILSSFLIVAGIISIKNILKLKQTNHKIVYFVFIIIFLIISSSISLNSTYNNKWEQLGFSEKSYLQEVQREFYDKIDRNTPRNAVFLSHPEPSLGFHALTGKKIFVSRGTHTSIYVDLFKKYAEAAVILYGNNSDIVKELLRKNNISYVLYDISWKKFTESEPLLVPLKYESLLNDNGISYEKVRSRLDPAKIDVPLYDMLMVKSPKNLFFNSTLMNYLEKIDEIKIQDELVYAYYKVVI